MLKHVHAHIVPFKPYNVTVYGINIKGKGLRKQVINFTQEGGNTTVEIVPTVCVLMLSFDSPNSSS